MLYLLLSDYEAALRPEDLTLLQCDNPALTEPALAPYQSHDPGQEYPAGIRIYDEMTGMYTSLQNVPAGLALDNTDYWVAGDSRPPELADAVLRLTLLHLASRLAMGPLPPTLEARALAARAWLQAQANGEAQPVLPRINDGPARFGSFPRTADGRGMW